MPCTLHATPYTVHPIPNTLHRTPYTLHPTSYTLHPTPYTLHPAPYTLHPTPHTPHPTPYTLHPTPYTIHHTPYTLHPTRCNKRTPGAPQAMAPAGESCAGDAAKALSPPPLPAPSACRVPASTTRRSLRPSVPPAPVPAPVLESMGSADAVSRGVTAALSPGEASRGTRPGVSTS